MCCSKEDPSYEVDEGIECKCIESGVEAEWVWNESQGVYICTGCGETQ